MLVPVVRYLQRIWGAQIPRIPPQDADCADQRDRGSVPGESSEPAQLPSSSSSSLSAFTHSALEGTMKGTCVFVSSRVIQSIPVKNEEKSNSRTHHTRHTPSADLSEASPALPKSGVRVQLRDADPSGCILRLHLRCIGVFSLQFRPCICIHDLLHSIVTLCVSVSLVGSPHGSPTRTVAFFSRICCRLPPPPPHSTCAA